MKPRPPPVSVTVERGDGVREIIRGETIERVPCVAGHAEHEECDLCRCEQVGPLPDGVEPLRRS